MLYHENQNPAQRMMDWFADKLSPSTLIVLFLATSILCFNFFLRVPGWVGTASYVKKFMILDQHDDSWYPMDVALKYLNNDYPDDGTVYRHIFFDQGIKFQYPLTSLLIPQGLSNISDEYINGLMGLAWISIIVNIFFVVKIFGVFFPFKSRIDAMTGILSLCVISLLFYPMVKAYNLGQVQTWINALFSACFYCWVRGWQAPSGVLLGLICLLKPQYGLIVLWGVLRKSWRFVFYCAAVLFMGFMLSVAMFGLENNLDYLPVLKYISRHGETYYSNQSINGLLNRFFFNGHILEFQTVFPPFNFIVYYGTLLFAIIQCCLAYWVPRALHKENGVFDFTLVAITATIISPIAWGHHYGIFLPIYVFIFCYLMTQKKLNLCYWFIFGFSYCLSANYIPVLKKLAAVPYWNILLSYRFLGALILLAFIITFLFKNQKIAIPHNAKDF